MRGRACTLLSIAALACSSKSDVRSGGSGSSVEPAVPVRPTFTLFALAEVRGQIGPCGCTSDPLGDLARSAKVVMDARAAGPALFVDAGGLLYSRANIPAQLAAQEELKADLLATTYKTELAAAAIGLGPADLAKGPAKLRSARQAINVAPDAGVERAAPVVVPAGTAKVGVFGVIAEGAVPGLAIEPPVAAARSAVAELEKEGAQVIVALVQAPSKRDAVKLVREIGGIDLAIAGLGAAAPEPEGVEAEPQKVGDGWLVVPANRGQVMSRIDVTLRGAGPLADAIGPAAAAAKIATLDHRIAALETDLAKYATDPSADKAFVAQRRAERDELARLREDLATRPLVVPASGSYFTLDQVRINKTLACAPEVDRRVTAFYEAAGKENAKAAAATKIPRPAKGKPGYSGGATCEDCHDDAARFWKKTVHAKAWQTLVDRGQQYDFDCVSCHVTGWEQPGGSNLAFNENLRDVQCEVCHGPSSIHVAKGGEEKPAATILRPASELCATQCHTKEHSDTFQLEAYLRDVVGPGHGEKLREELGDGPTGAQLRKAALDKAGREIGANCTR